MFLRRIIGNDLKFNIKRINKLAKSLIRNLETIIQRIVSIIKTRKNFR